MAGVNLNALMRQRILTTGGARRAMSTKGGFTVANPALEHVLSRMRCVDEPRLRVYPSAQSNEMCAFGRIVDTMAIVGSPGPRILLALDHPSFVDNSLEHIQKAYAHRVTPAAAAGTPMVLCDPSRKILRSAMIAEPTEKNKLAELPPEKMHAAMGLAAAHHHMTEYWSYEVVERSDAFGGWPCVLLMPTTAARVLARDVAVMWPSEIAHEVLREASFMQGARATMPAVRFERNGHPVDEECSVQQLGMWAEAGERVEVVIDGATRVPLRFDAAYARAGQRAAHAERDARRGTDLFFTVASVAVVGLFAFSIWEKQHRSES